MKNYNRAFKLILLILLLVVLMIVTSSVDIMAIQSVVELGSARNFAVLAGSAITNTGPTTIDGTAGGDVGLTPEAGSAITGINSEIVNGTIYVVDAAGPAGSVMDTDLLTAAKNDLITAYNDAAGRLPTEIISADLNGRTLTAGVYRSESSIALAVDGTLILDGQNNPNAVFIFQTTASTLITGSGSKIVLINGAKPCHVFWKVGSSATLGTNSDFVGHILALTSITVSNGANIQGQLLAINGAVTLENNTINNDVCLSTGSLEITKIVTGDTSGITLPPFVITVTGPEGYTSTRTFTSSETFTWTNLVPGTYTMTENKTGFGSEWTVTGEGSIQVIADQTAVMTATNSYVTEQSSYGSLSVTKVITGDTSSITLPLFVITVTGPGEFSSTRTFVSGETFTWTKLIPGTYTMTENKSGLSNTWTVTGEGNIQVIADQKVEMTVTNSYTEEIPEVHELPETGGNVLLFFVTGISIALIGAFFLTGNRRKKKIKI